MIPSLSRPISRARGGIPGFEASDDEDVDDRNGLVVALADEVRAGKVLKSLQRWTAGVQGLDRTACIPQWTGESSKQAGLCMTTARSLSLPLVAAREIDLWLTSPVAPERWLLRCDQVSSREWMAPKPDT